VLIIIYLFSILLNIPAKAQIKDSIYLNLPDTSILKNDKSSNDSIEKSVPKSKQVLDAPVVYSAKDSMRISVKEKKLYLFGDAEVNYKEINLKAAYIELDFGKNTLFAEGFKDSTGREIGRPEFKEGTQVIKSKTILYNFDTKKGLITDVITQEADGYIHGDLVKKMENDVMFIKHGKYTTCEADHPHFYFNISKLKVIPDDKIISGPANLVVEDVPTPLAIPFGFFPNKKGRKNGILIPQYGESQALGFFLKEGGYYVGLSENMDLALTGDIYTRGSWATRAHTNYTKRYKYAGSFDARYSQIQISEKDFPDYQLNKDFFIKWTHRQDQKARPNSSFSADVSAGTSSFNRLNSAASTDFLQNAFQSSINYNKSWAGKPYSLNISARHTQNTQDSSVVISLPEAAFVVQRIFPLKRKSVIGSERWYEKIGVSLTASMKNEIATKEYLLFTPASLKNFRNGIQHTVPISTSFKTMKYFTITPSINITERWYFKTLEQSYNNELQRVITDTITKFARAGEYNLNTSFTTKIYGMYQYRKGPVEAIRHVITPTLGLTYRPDFDTRKFGYFGDSTGALSSYSPYQLGIYGVPAPGQQGLISMRFINNIEMKTRAKSDSTSGKKIKLMENLDFGSGYNMLADSLNWQNITINGRTQLFDKVSLLFGGAIDPYAIDTAGRKINQFMWDTQKQIGRITAANIAISFSLNSKKKSSVTSSKKATDEELNMIQRDRENFADFNVPWNLSVNYNINYSKPGFVKQLTQAITFNGDINLTPRWKIGFDSGYDFVKKQMTYSRINIYRDLHCWEMKFNWVPFGVNKSYLLEINVKSAVLQDMKLSRRRSWFDYMQ
jgi:hypothetical protein